jgi:hypothetical protein
VATVSHTTATPAAIVAVAIRRFMARCGISMRDLLGCQ